MTKNKKNKSNKKPKSEEPIPLEPLAVEEDAKENPDGSSEEEVSDEVRLAELNDRYIRMVADFENFRKRTQRERGELTQRAVEGLVSDLIPVLDHFEIGLQTARDQQAQEAVLEGFTLVYDQLIAGLKKVKLEPVDAVGETFNPHQHEAITYAPSLEVDAEIVMEQLRRGYRLGDRLVRPAQVIVSSGPPTPTASVEDAPLESDEAEKKEVS